MRAPDKLVSTKGLPFRRASFAALFRVIAGLGSLGAILLIMGQAVLQRPVHAENSHRTKLHSHNLESAAATLPAASWQDSRGDGFPDGARLDNARDRGNFTHWFTFLAETQYYSRSPHAKQEVQDCAALIRYAYRNSLMAHSPAWGEDADLPYDPGFGDVAKYNYPYGPLGRALFRSKPGPLASDDFTEGAFGEFADSATLLRYNTYLISRDIRAAAPGDLLILPSTGRARAVSHHVVCGEILLSTLRNRLDCLPHRRYERPSRSGSRGAGNNSARAPGLALAAFKEQPKLFGSLPAGNSALIST